MEQLLSVGLMTGGLPGDNIVLVNNIKDLPMDILSGCLVAWAGEIGQIDPLPQAKGLSSHRFWDVQVLT